MIRQNWPAICPFFITKWGLLPTTLASTKGKEQPIQSKNTLIRSLSPGTIWSLRSEASLNWLALGLLLAAWNAAGNDASNAPDSAANRPRRPEILRGYSYISVRAVNQVTSER